MGKKSEEEFLLTVLDRTCSCSHTILSHFAVELRLVYVTPPTCPGVTGEHVTPMTADPTVMNSRHVQ
ncbi:hypothetical protein GN956_G26885 [Arapaima gigas]